MAKEISFADVSKKAIHLPIRPMLATLGDNIPFSDANWVFEYKYDGYRIIAVIADTVTLYSRNGKDVTHTYQKVADRCAELPFKGILDGEITVEDEAGVPQFQLLQQYQEFGGHITYHVFDILQYEGFNLLDLPLFERKEILKQLHFKKPLVHVMGKVKDGEGQFVKAQKLGYEGVIAKRLNSIYLPGNRTENWLKIKAHLREEAIICGFTNPKGTREVLGSLLLGIYEGKKLIYIGNVGTGFNHKILSDLERKLEPLKRKTSPFGAFQHQIYRDVHWVQPKLVCEISFAGWTADNLVRQAVYLGIRRDKKPEEVQRKESLFRK